LEFKKRVPVTVVIEFDVFFLLIMWALPITIGFEGVRA